MINPYSPNRARRLIAKFDTFLEQLESKYGVPADWLRAVLYREMTQIDLLDLVADFAVYFYYFRRRLYRLLFRKELPATASRFLGKKDSSTGYAQIFGFVAINAANFALDRGIADYAGLGIVSDHRLDPQNLDDLWMIWRRLNRDRRFNLELGALNLLSAAEEMNGSIHCSAFSPEEMKKTFTRYNANVREITRYGEETYRTYLDYQRKV